MFPLQQMPKDFDSGLRCRHGLLISPGTRMFKEESMAQKTCAACDCTLAGDPIKVTIGGKTVDACCDDCAQKLKEAGPSARSARR